MKNCAWLCPLELLSVFAPFVFPSVSQHHIKILHGIVGGRPGNNSSFSGILGVGP